MAISITLSAKGNHLVFTDVKFKDGIQDGALKMGVLKIEDASKGSFTLKKANKLKWSMSDTEDESGFYEVTRDGSTEDED